MIHKKSNVTKSVTFAFQNNAGADDADGNEPPPVPKNEDGNYEPNLVATPAWDSARSHRATEQKMKLRADYLEKLLKADIVPLQYYGGDKLPGYLHPLSSRMAELIRKQGKARAKLALQDIREMQALSKLRADTATEMCKQLYEQEGDPNFPEAEQAIVELVTKYRATEITRLDALEKRETAKKPDSDEKLSLQMCKIFPHATGQDRQAAPKRGRSPSAGPPTKRGRSQGRNKPSSSRGRSRNRSPQPGTSGTSRNPKGNSNAPKGQQKPRPEKPKKSKGNSRPNESKGKSLPSDDAKNLMELMQAISKAAQKFNFK